MATRKKTEEIAEATPVVEDSKPIVPAKEAPVDPHQIVVVRNGFNGLLVYKSPKTGEVIKWGKFGDEQEMEVGELRTVRNTAKGFFVNNWFMFDEEYQWVLDYLGVRGFYKNSISIENMDEVFNLPPEEIEEKLSKLPDGQKRSLGYRAREMVVSGEIDSRRAISAIEKALNIVLIER